MIIPPNAHTAFELSVTMGATPTIVFGLPGVHGHTTHGTHGPTVTEPRLLAIIAATAGLAGLLHNTNGITFTNGLKSRIEARGITPTTTRFSGVITSGIGATPIEQRATENAVTQRPTIVVYTKHR